MVMVWYGGKCSYHVTKIFYCLAKEDWSQMSSMNLNTTVPWYGMVPDHTIGECKRSASHAPNVVHTIYTAKLKVKPPLMQPFPDDIGIILAFR